MPTKPTAAELKPLPHGEGSISWDAARGKITLRHAIDGKPYTERGETRHEVIAKRNRRRRDAEIRAELVGDGQTTVAKLLADWLAFEGQGKAPQTVRCYQWSTDHLSAHLGDVAAMRLEVAHIEAMYAALIADGMSSSSMIKLRSHLKMALAFGMRRNYLPSSIDHVRLAKMPAGAPRYARAQLWLSLEEYDIVRQHLMMQRDARSALFLAMMLTGLRPAEAAGLRWAHVDLERRVLHVEGAIQRGANGSTGSYTTTLKTDNHGDQAHREIPIPGDLRLVLAWLRDHRDSEYVFSEGGEFVTVSVISEMARSIAVDAGVRYVNPNGYRHTFASVCRHHGMPYEQLAKLMGHKDASMIIKTYGHPIVPLAPIDLERYLGSPE